jgi:hypothetical protein
MKTGKLFYYLVEIPYYQYEGKSEKRYMHRRSKKGGLALYQKALNAQNYWITSTQPGADTEAVKKLHPDHIYIEDNLGDGFVMGAPRLFAVEENRTDITPIGEAI